MWKYTPKPPLFFGAISSRIVCALFREVRQAGRWRVADKSSSPQIDLPLSQLLVLPPLWWTQVPNNVKTIQTKYLNIFCQEASVLFDQTYTRCFLSKWHQYELDCESKSDQLVVCVETKNLCPSLRNVHSRLVVPRVWPNVSSHPWWYLILLAPACYGGKPSVRPGRRCLDTNNVLWT